MQLAVQKVNVWPACSSRKGALRASTSIPQTGSNVRGRLRPKIQNPTPSGWEAAYLGAF